MYLSYYTDVLQNVSQTQDWFFRNICIRHI